METLAQAGLTLDEILAHDNWTDPPPALLQAMEEAVRRGRLLGAAAIKRVRHQAALNGNTSAQAHQLALLTAEDEPGGVTVERVILHGEA
ncbi:MAG: hypothetical protein OEW12_09420 [Deltaproteobacteria bacterium]|nr:hypothetical protein [Deltaproteobacteria bacterium]